MYKRDVDLARWAPYDVIGKAVEFEERVKAENPEFNLVWNELDIIRLRSYIFDADEYGIARYEKLLGIFPEGTLEERRSKVYAEWNRKVVWTHRTLEDYLNNLLGFDSYEMELEYDNYKLIFNVLVNNPKFNNISLNKSLREIVPANLEIDVRVLMVEYLFYKDKTNNYKTKYWMTNEVPSGRIPTQSYKGITVNEKLVIGSGGRISDNRPYRSQNIRSGESANKRGGNT